MLKDAAELVERDQPLGVQESTDTLDRIASTASFIWVHIGLTPQPDDGGAKGVEPSA